MVDLKIAVAFKGLQVRHGAPAFGFVISHSDPNELGRPRIEPDIGQDSDHASVGSNILSPDGARTLGGP